jgi:hypothetical protein
MNAVIVLNLFGFSDYAKLDQELNWTEKCKREAEQTRRKKQSNSYIFKMF